MDDLLRSLSTNCSITDALFDSVSVSDLIRIRIRLGSKTKNRPNPRPSRCPNHYNPGFHRTETHPIWTRTSSALGSTIHIDVSSIGHDDDDDEDEMEDEADFANLCDDRYTEQIVKLIQEQRSSSNRFRSRMGWREHSDGQHGEHQKFMTTNKFEPASSSFAEIYGDEKQRCFVDVLMIEFHKNRMKQQRISSISAFIKEEEYDTESIVADLEEPARSNIKHSVSVSPQFMLISSKLILQRTIRNSLYSPGKRYFYWEYYRNLEDLRNKVCRGIWEENIGYTLGEWFVERKYENLKEELLSNLLVRFSLQHFDNTMSKATEKWRAWNKSCGQIRCNRSYWKKYGIEPDDTISLEHMVSILCYTNFSTQCYALSATYRKIHEYESDKDMKARHREYWNWAKLLRETVECFGISMDESPVHTFYHGVSDTLIFDSTSIRLCGPVSMTGGSLHLYVHNLCRNKNKMHIDFKIACSIFGAKGLVINIKKSTKFLPYFDCRYWSDFTSEDEKLFVGGLRFFDFGTIRNMTTTPKADYHRYIETLTMFHYMIEGWPWNNGIIKKKYAMTLDLLIKEEMAMKSIKSLPSVVPPYILKLWLHFLNKIENVERNWNHLNTEITNTKKTHFGFKAFSNLFTISDGAVLDCCSLLKILPNLNSLNVFVNKYRIYIPSHPLNDAFASNMLSAIEYINNSPALRSSFTAMNIVYPSDDISEFVKANNGKFREFGWCLKRETYRESVFHPIYKPCDDCLSVQRL